MEGINQDKILSEVLKDVEKNEKTRDDIKNNIRKLQAENYTIEELDKLDEILKLKMEENESNMPLMASIVGLIISAVTLIISCCLENTGTAEFVYVKPICMILIVALVLFSICCVFGKIARASRRNAASIRMRIAIFLYKESMQL